MHDQTVERGELRVRVVDNLPERTPPDLLVVLCHGFGAPADDLVPLGAELMRMRPALASRVRFAFPEAPLTLDALGLPGGRAWWPLDMGRITQMIESGELRDLRGEHPAGMLEAREMLRTAVESLVAENDVPPDRLVLGGFSQGAMIATDLALRLERPPVALCLYSGTVVCEAEWRKLAETRSFEVVQSHGRADPILPYAAAEWLRDLLVETGSRVEFLPFDGPHTISLAVLERTGDLLERLLA